MYAKQILINLKKFTTDFLRCYKFSIIYFFFLLYVAFKPNGFIFSSVLIVNIISIMLLLALITKIPSKFIKLILNIIIIFFISWATFFSLEFSDWIWTNSVLSILNTDSKEASDMGYTFLFTAIISIIINITLILLSEKEFKKKLPFPLSAIIIFFCFTLLAVGYTTRNLEPRQPASFTTKLLRVKELEINHQNVIYLTYAAPILYSNISTFYIALQEHINTRNHIKNIKERELPIYLETDTTNTQQVDRIYLIIGETSIRYHYTLYGYNRPTTPFLDSLNKSQTKSLDFYNAITPASTTVPALLRLLSFSGIHFSNDDLKYMSILGTATNNGYETHWISNQPAIGKHESLISTFPTEAQNTYFSDFQPPIDLDFSTVKDIELIPIIKERHNIDKKQFTIVHLFGSHINYTSKFDNIDQEAIPKSTEDKFSNNIDNYDRSIHHTDRVLREIYNILKNDNKSIAIYISDHGEIISMGHGFMKEYRSQYSIPLIFFNFTDIDIDNLVKKYKNSEDENFNTVNLCYVLAELMGYRVTEDRVQFALKNSPYIYLHNGEIKKYESIKNN